MYEENGLHINFIMTMYLVVGIQRNSFIIDGETMKICVHKYVGTHNRRKN